MVVIGVVLLVVLFIGVSYAIWRVSFSQKLSNEIASSCINIHFTEDKPISLQNAFPIYDEEGSKLVPYSFTIENTCDLFTSYVVQLEMTSSSTLPTKYIRTMMNNEEILDLNEYELSDNYVNQDTVEARVLAKGSLGNGDSEDYTLRLWIDSDVDQNTTEAIGKTLSARVTIMASPSTYSPVDYGFYTLHDAILANEYQVTELETSLDKIHSKQAPDFTLTAPIMEWQDIHTSRTETLSYTMPDPVDVGSGKDYASALTNENIYVGLARSYRFSSSEGKYYLEDMIYQDSKTVDFTAQDYYICASGTNVSSSGVLMPYNNMNCTTMYKVSGFLSSETSEIVGSDDVRYPAIKYVFRISEIYSQEEIESDKSDKGLYEMTDDYGTSYYYRGSVRNNYVSFAGYYWRIIRINGDGSIRLLYAGETKDASGDDAQIGTQAFHNIRNLPLYAGYMYGNSSGTSLDEVNANINDSNIKSYLDRWYEENLSNYSSYLADSGFCNDRSLSSRSNNGNGVSASPATYYSAYDRYTVSYSPRLDCPNATNDLFTVQNSLGNQALKYPIGLITADELMLAGYRYGYVNQLSYAFSGSYYWTMTPSLFDAGSSAANAYRLVSGGLVNDYWVTSQYGVRPVINVRSDVEITGGIGTQNEPFVIKEI